MIISATAYPIHEMSPAAKSAVIFLTQTILFPLHVKGRAINILMMKVGIAQIGAHNKSAIAPPIAAAIAATKAKRNNP